jgi:flagellar biosynthetic protein FliR
VSTPLTTWAASCLVLGLRLAPAFAFAPPFTLVRMPATFRVLFGLGLAVTLVASKPASAILPDDGLQTMFFAAVRELGLGLMFVLTFQVAFGALYFAGRTIDIQAGYGLATLIDPASQSQMPLIGTLFAYAAGAMFFAFNGHIELLRLFSASLDSIPLGAWRMPHSVERLAAFMSVSFASALGVAGATILVLFLVDLSIAALSRTVPQMNVLVLGFQVKTLVLLLVLPTAFGFGGALLLRLMTTALQAIPTLI